MPDACVSAAAPGLPSAKVPPALAAHLDELHVLALNLEQVARAMKLLADVEVSHEMLQDLAAMIEHEAAVIEKGLDGATLDNLPARRWFEAGKK